VVVMMMIWRHGEIRFVGDEGVNILFSGVKYDCLRGFISSFYVDIYIRALYKRVKSPEVTFTLKRCTQTFSSGYVYIEK